MMMRYENYQYKPAQPPRTARDLARALGVPDTVPLAVPDDRLVVIEALDKPDGTLIGEQIVVGIDAAAETNLTGRIGERTTVLYLEGDFPAGTYEREADDSATAGD
ncbi:hypothetical protein [Amycolatopsis sp. NPDC004378]